MEASREEAASNALKPLLQMGLDRTNKLKSFEESQASLQGKHLIYLIPMYTLSFLFILILSLLLVCLCVRFSDIFCLPLLLCICMFSFAELLYILN